MIHSLIKVMPSKDDRIVAADEMNVDLDRIYVLVGSDVEYISRAC